MHEFAEVRAIIAQACSRIAPGTHIARLTLIIGEASGHSVDHIESHFLEAARGTPAEGATLHFVAERLAAQCVNCGTGFRSEELALTCGRCGGTELRITAGKDVRLAGVEVKG